MPIYAFECSDCGHHFDRLQKLSDPDPGGCPACGFGGVRRRVTAPAFRLAGSGWYETDFKGERDRRRNLAGEQESGGGKAAGNADPGASDGGGKAGTTSDKPAAGEVGKTAPAVTGGAGTDTKKPAAGAA